MGFRLESELCSPVKRYFKNKSYSAQNEEVEFFERRIDLYAYSPKLEETVAVEMKLKNWKKALHQAMLYQLCSDYVYLAMPFEVFRLIDLDKLNEHGIGFLAIYKSGFCKKIVTAKKSKHTKSHYRNDLIGTR